MSSDNYFIAVHPSCGHTRALWIVDLLDSVDAATHTKQLQDCTLRGLTVVQAANRDEAVRGLGKECDVCKRRGVTP